MSSDTYKETPPAVSMSSQHHDVNREFEMAAEELRLERINAENRRMYDDFLRKHPDGRIVPKY